MPQRRRDIAADYATPLIYELAAVAFRRHDARCCFAALMPPGVMPFRFAFSAMLAAVAAADMLPRAISMSRHQPSRCHSLRDGRNYDIMPHDTAAAQSLAGRR